MIKLSTFRNKYVHNFIRHNKNIFKKSNSEENIVLTEFNGWPITHIAISNCLLALENNYTFKKIAYSENSFKKFLKKKNFYEKSKFILGKFFNLRTFGIYKSFGINDFLSIDYDKTLENNSKIILKKILGELKFKRDVLKIKINKIPIGDLIYDSYLKEYNQPTIEIKSNSFEEYLHAAIQYFLIWEKFFKTKKVLGVLSSHSVYMSSIPSRIGIYYNSICLVCNAEKLYRLSKKNKESDKEFLFFNKTKKKINKKELRVGLSIAAKRLDSRFNGKIGVDMRYSKKSAWSTKNDEKVLKKTKKIKVLIAAHCFFDSPNGLGDNLFVDFYEWISFLASVSHKTDYDWYIKTHPDYLPGNMEIINNLSKKFKNITILNSSVSHHSIIKDKIDFVLTVYVSVSFEYAYNKKYVINASLNNPSINYKYNFNPSSIKIYRDMLMKLNKLRLNIDKEEVLECYLMHRILRANNIYFQDLDDFKNKFDKSINNLDTNFYEYAIKDYNYEHHLNIMKKFDNFINNKNYYL